jgi:hypothetical protein
LNVKLDWKRSGSELVLIYVDACDVRKHLRDRLGTAFFSPASSSSCRVDPPPALGRLRPFTEDAEWRDCIDASISRPPSEYPKLVPCIRV